MRTCLDVAMSSLRLRAGSVSCSWAPTAGRRNCPARPSCTRSRPSARSYSRRRRRRPWRSARWSVRNSRRSWRYDKRDPTPKEQIEWGEEREKECPLLPTRHMLRAKSQWALKQGRKMTLQFKKKLEWEKVQSKYRLYRHGWTWMNQFYWKKDCGL